MQRFDASQLLEELGFVHRAARRARGGPERLLAGTRRGRPQDAAAGGVTAAASSVGAGALAGRPDRPAKSAPSSPGAGDAAGGDGSGAAGAVIAARSGDALPTRYEARHQGFAAGRKPMRFKGRSREYLD